MSELKRKFLGTRRTPTPWAMFGMILIVGLLNVFLNMVFSKGNFFWKSIGFGISLGVSVFVLTVAYERWKKLDQREERILWKGGENTFLSFVITPNLIVALIFALIDSKRDILLESVFLRNGSLFVVLVLGSYLIWRRNNKLFGYSLKKKTVLDPPENYKPIPSGMIAMNVVIAVGACLLVETNESFKHIAWLLLVFGVPSSLGFIYFTWAYGLSYGWKYGVIAVVNLGAAYYLFQIV